MKPCIKLCLKLDLPLNFSVISANKCRLCPASLDLSVIRKKKKIKKEPLTNTAKEIKVTRVNYTKSLCRKINLVI